MSLITNFGELKTAVSEHLMNPDLGGNEDRFVRNGHDMLMRELRALVDMTQDADLTLDQSEVALTFNPKTIVSFYLDTQDQTRLYERTSRQVDTIRELRSPTELIRYPYYAREGSNLTFVPFTGSYPAKMKYKSNFDFFVNDADTNWLLDNYPGAYEYASLVYAAQFISDAEKQAEAERMANFIIESIKDENRDRMHLNAGALSPAVRYTP